MSGGPVRGPILQSLPGDRPVRDYMRGGSPPFMPPGIGGEPVTRQHSPEGQPPGMGQERLHPQDLKMQGMGQEGMGPVGPMMGGPPVRQPSPPFQQTIGEIMQREPSGKPQAPGGGAPPFQPPKPAGATAVGSPMAGSLAAKQKPFAVPPRKKSQYGGA